MIKFLMMVSELVNIIMIGHLNNHVLLAGVGLGNMTANIIGSSVTLGMNSALDTFVSQAYGSKNMYMCGVYLNRSRFVISVALSPVCIILLFSEKILITLG